ncbi:MAG: N-acetylmuramoyl-L-alanine amidase [Bacteroidales bacterium]|nr:N-acetylmuramoyl-L-alanine amidase [Bacteroidales bacterium]
MRTVTLVIIHCSAVRPGQRSSARDIDGWHRARGWKSIGYHYVVRRDGTVEEGRRPEEVGAHCTGHNGHSIGICYEGGLDEAGKPADTRTPAQRLALRQLVERMHARFPKALVVGHHDLNPMKACPCFDVVREYRGL